MDEIFVLIKLRQILIGFYIKTEIDPTGGYNYTISGVNQVLAVPYALYAEKAGSCVNAGPVVNFTVGYNSGSGYGAYLVATDGSSNIPSGSTFIWDNSDNDGYSWTRNGTPNGTKY